VSNAGRNVPEVGSPTGRWAGQLFRTLNLVQQQEENSRKRLLFAAHNLGQRKVAFWSIEASSLSYGLPDSLSFSAEDAVRAANLRTHLNPFSPAEITLLLKAGYMGADASLRKRKLAENSPPANFDALGDQVRSV
jgi:NTE family protein